MLVVRLLRTPIFTSRLLFLPLPRCRNASRESAITAEGGHIAPDSYYSFVRSAGESFLWFLWGLLIEHLTRGKKSNYKIPARLAGIFSFRVARRLSLPRSFSVQEYKKFARWLCVLSRRKVALNFSFLHQEVLVTYV